jgi:hypothetical protein
MSEFKGVSAVEWFANKLDEIIPYIDEETAREFNELLAEAKAMFEQQVKDAFNAGFDDGCGFIEDMKYKEAQQYYNETYGKKNKQ